MPAPGALERASIDFGQTVGADDAYLVLRGMRSLPLRLAQHAHSALRVAQWLQGRAEVARVLCPALPDDPRTRSGVASAPAPTAC